MKRLAVLFCGALLALTLLGASSAGDGGLLAGDPDLSFGSSGFVTHDLGTGEDPFVSGIVVQPDGKIVVAGGSTPGDRGLLLARYLPNGTPDPSFGHVGYVETLTGDWAFAQAIALQPDGKIVVAGSSYQGDDHVLSEFTLARYDANGALDATFGAGGITNTVVPEQPGTYWSEGAGAVVVLPSGAIVVGGDSGWSGGERESSTSTVLLGYKSDGSLDPAFGDGGVVRSLFRGGGGIAAQPDGKLVLSGKSAPHTVALARYELDGSLDATFGSAGVASHAVAMSRKFSLGTGPIAFQHGKIVELAAVTMKGVSHAFPVLVRFGASGRLDTTFGKHGFLELRHLSGVPGGVTQHDGRILLATVEIGYQGTEVARLLPDGRLDPSFGKKGIVRFGDGLWPALASQADGRTVVGGEFGNSWTLARITGGNDCVVPGVRGKTVSRASAVLKASHCLTGRVSKQFSGKIARDHVISTAPPLGDRRPGRWSVDLVVSRGRRA